jgi:hypothetical protein
MYDQISEVHSNWNSPALIISRIYTKNREIRDFLQLLKCKFGPRNFSKFQDRVGTMPAMAMLACQSQPCTRGRPPWSRFLQGDFRYCTLISDDQKIGIAERAHYSSVISPRNTQTRLENYRRTSNVAFRTLTSIRPCKVYVGQIKKNYITNVCRVSLPDVGLMGNLAMIRPLAKELIALFLFSVNVPWWPIQESDRAQNR